MTHSSGFKKQAVTGEEWGAAEPLKALFKQVLQLTSSRTDISRSFIHDVHERLLKVEMSNVLTNFMQTEVLVLTKLISGKINSNGSHVTVYISSV